MECSIKQMQQVEMVEPPEKKKKDKKRMLAELEQRIDEQISHEQWVQLKEWASSLNDVTILPSAQEQQNDWV